MNNWISTKNKLPKNNTYVLIHLTKDNWIDKNCRTSHEKFCLYCDVAQFSRGITQKQREELKKNNNPRAIMYSPGDEWGNNLVPYFFDPFGPGSYFGQEVDYWMDIPKLEETK